MTIEAEIDRAIDHYAFLSIVRPTPAVEDIAEQMRQLIRCVRPLIENAAVDASERQPG